MTVKLAVKSKKMMNREEEKKQEWVWEE